MVVLAGPESGLGEYWRAVLESSWRVLETGVVSNIAREWWRVLKSAGESWRVALESTPPIRSGTDVIAQIERVGPGLA